MSTNDELPRIFCVNFMIFVWIDREFHGDYEFNKESMSFGAI